MRLSDPELHDLAAFFARRFDLRLRTLETPAPPGLEAAWQDQIRARMEAGTLTALLAQARHRYPDDTNLRDVVELLHEPDRSANRVVALLLGGVATAAALFVGTVLVGAVGVSLALRAPVVEAPARTAALAVVETGAPVSPERAIARPVEGRCAGMAGEVVGYWYAGEQAPGAMATLERMVNVRADYPSRDNGWDARAHIRCVLHPGDRVRVSEAPVRVDGGRYWVPLVAGDLLAGDSV